MSCNDTAPCPCRPRSSRASTPMVRLSPSIVGRFQGGTLINYSGYNHFKMEAFRALVINMNDQPWVLYTNAKLSHEQFAEMMRARINLPKIIYWGL